MSPATGTSGDIRLTGRQEAAQCHLMPCKIGPLSKPAEAKAREYFWPTVRELKTFGEDDDYDLGRQQQRPEARDDKPILIASFRGRPLQGRTLQLPDGCTGYALAAPPDNKISSAGNSTKNDRSFKSFTYWNWDTLPDKDDAVVKALKWVELAKAIHDPIDT